MRGIVLVSHGMYAEAFKGSLQMIAGEVTNLYSCCLLPTDGPEQFQAKLEEIEPEFDKYEDVLVFADLFGGSPCNTSFVKFAQNPKVTVIAGMNFPMVLTAILSENETPDNLIAQGQEGIVDVRKFMASMSTDED